MNKHDVALYRLQTSFRLGVSLLALQFAWPLQAQVTGKPQSRVSVSAVLAAADDPRINLDSQEVHHALESLPPEERTSVLRQLIAGKHPELAREAASRAIRERRSGLSNSIALRISTWSFNSKGVILQEVAATRDQFVEIPRALVRDALRNTTAFEPSESSSIDPIGRAAILLAKTGNRTDRQMLLELAEARRESWGVWMAIAQTGELDIRRASLALSVYKNSSIPIFVRVAAASALEVLDGQAGAFAINEIESFLAKFADRGIGEILGGAMQSADFRQKLAYKDLIENLHLLASLLVLKGVAAEHIAFRNLSSSNEFIRIFCGIVAAKRWPEKFLKSGQGLFSDQEYDDLLGVLALNNSDHAEAAIMRRKTKRLANSQTQIPSVGIGRFGSPGGILKWFLYY